MNKKLTVEDIREKLEEQLKFADGVEKDEQGYTEIDRIEMELHNLESDPEQYVACANCLAGHDCCEYCGYGNNTPPMGI